MAYERDGAIRHHTPFFQVNRIRIHPAQRNPYKKEYLAELLGDAYKSIVI